MHAYVVDYLIAYRNAVVQALSVSVTHQQAQVEEGQER